VRWSLQRTWILWYIAGLAGVFVTVVAILLVSRSRATAGALERLQGFEAVFDPGSPSAQQFSSLSFTRSGPDVERDVPYAFPVITGGDGVARALDLMRRLRRAVDWGTTAVDENYVLPDRPPGWRTGATRWDPRGFHIMLNPEQKKAMRFELECFRRALGFLTDRINEWSRIIATYVDAENNYEAVLRGRAADAVGPALEAMSRFDPARTEAKLLEKLGQARRGLPAIPDDVRPAHVHWLLDRAPGLLDRIFADDPDIVIWDLHPDYLAERIVGWLQQRAGPRQLAVLLRTPALRREHGRVKRFHVYFLGQAEAHARLITPDEMIAVLHTLGEEITSEYKATLGRTIVLMEGESRRAVFLWIMDHYPQPVGRKLSDWLLDTLMPSLAGADIEAVTSGPGRERLSQRIQQILAESPATTAVIAVLVLKLMELRVPPYESPPVARKTARMIAEHAREQDFSAILEACARLRSGPMGSESQDHPRYVFADEFLNRGHEAAAFTTLVTWIPSAPDAQPIELLHRRLREPDLRKRLVEAVLARLETGRAGEETVLTVLRSPEKLDVLPRVVAAFYKIQPTNPAAGPWFGRIVRVHADRRAIEFLIREWYALNIETADDQLARLTGDHQKGRDAWNAWLDRRGSLKDQLPRPK